MGGHNDSFGVNPYIHELRLDGNSSYKMLFNEYANFIGTARWLRTF